MAFLARLLRLKIEDPPNSGTYKFVGGMQSISVTTSIDNVSVSDLVNQQYSEVIPKTGPIKYSISGGGVFKNSIGERLIQSCYLVGDARRFVIEFGNGDKVIGFFIVTSFDRNGGASGAEMYNLALDSSGAVSFSSAGGWETLTTNWESITTNWESLV